MGLFDRFKKADPEPASVPEPKKTSKRNYEGAWSKSTANWNVALTKQDEVLRLNHKQLVARSRDLYKNTAYARSTVNAYKTNVLGSEGIKLQSLAKFQSGQADKLARETIEKHFKKWGKVGSCDVTGRFSFKDIQDLVVTNMLIDGEAFIHIIRGKNAGNNYNLALQIIDSQRVNPELTDPVWNKSKNTIIGGIEYNKYGRPVAYYILNTDPTSVYTDYRELDYVRIDAKDIIHIFEPVYADQRRGMPIFTQGLALMYNLKEFQTAALQNARFGASRNFVLNEENPEEYSPENLEDNEDIDSTPVIDLSDTVGISRLPSGADLKLLDSKYPDSGYSEFYRSMLEGFAATVGLNYNTISGDLRQVNFSSLKHGFAQEKKNYKTYRKRIIQHFLEKVYEEWLQIAMISGKLVIKDTTALNGDIEKYMDVFFTAESFEPIDELKIASANSIALKDGTKTRTQIIAESGRDPEEVFHELETEIKILTDLGFTVNPANNSIVVNVTDGEEPDGE